MLVNIGGYSPLLNSIYFARFQINYDDFSQVIVYILLHLNYYKFPNLQAAYRCLKFTKVLKCSFSFYPSHYLNYEKQNLPLVQLSTSTFCTLFHPRSHINEKVPFYVNYWNNYMKEVKILNIIWHIFKYITKII